MKRPNKNGMSIFISGVTGFFARTNLGIYFISCDSFPPLVIFFLIQTLQCAELCGKQCYVYICIYILALEKQCMSTCVLCKHSNWSEGESLIIRTLMNNKHTVSKEPIAHIGLDVSQELCWSHTWDTGPRCQYPHAGWCSPNMTGDRCLWDWDSPKWGGSVLPHHHVALLVLEHIGGPVWPFPCIKSRIWSTYHGARGTDWGFAEAQGLFFHQRW